MNDAYKPCSLTDEKPEDAEDMVQAGGGRIFSRLLC
jgi:hypothetical protein